MADKDDKDNEERDDNLNEKISPNKERILTENINYIIYPEHLSRFNQVNPESEDKSIQSSEKYSTQIKRI